MFDYKFIKITKSIFGRFNYTEDYRKQIQEHAKKGWRLVQVVPLDWSSYGAPTQIDVVLERPTDWEEHMEITV